MDDPTAETFDQWGADFHVEFDWDDPAAVEAYEECSSADREGDDDRSKQSF